MSLKQMNTFLRETPKNLETLHVKSQSLLPLLRIIVTDSSGVLCELAENSTVGVDVDGWLLGPIALYLGNISLRLWCNEPVKCFHKPSMGSLYRYELPPVSKWGGVGSRGITLAGKR